MIAETKNEKEDEKLLDILTSGYKREVIEELVDNQSYTYTVNELSENVTGSYNSVRNFVKDLQRFNIVNLTKKSNSNLVEYNPESRYHDVLISLLKAENQPLEEAAKNYAEQIAKELDKENLHSIVLFGSVARGTADIDSDIDILILTKNNESTSKIKETARNHSSIDQEIQTEIVPVVESIQEFKENLEKNQRFEESVARDGIVLEGEELEFKN